MKQNGLRVVSSSSKIAKLTSMVAAGASSSSNAVHVLGRRGVALIDFQLPQRRNEVLHNLMNDDIIAKAMIGTSIILI